MIFDLFSVSYVIVCGTIIARGFAARDCASVSSYVCDFAIFDRSFPSHDVNYEDGLCTVSAMLTSVELRALNNHDLRPPRHVRKTLFGLRLWRPARQRKHTQLIESRRRPRYEDISCFKIGCINARSVSNKAATLCRTLVDEQLDILAVTETWHENATSVSLKRIAPPGFHFIEAARPIPRDARSDNIEFRNHGGLAFVLRDSIKINKREFDVNVSTFEYLCGYVTSADGQFMLFGVYRPGSQAVSDAFFDDLSAVLEQLAVYNCPVVVCGDFNIHVDRSDDKHAVQLLRLLQTFDMVQHVTSPDTRSTSSSPDKTLPSTVYTSLHSSLITLSSSSRCMPRNRPRLFSPSRAERGDGCP